MTGKYTAEALEGNRILDRIAEDVHGLIQSGRITDLGTRRRFMAEMLDELTDEQRKAVEAFASENIANESESRRGYTTIPSSGLQSGDVSPA